MPTKVKQVEGEQLELMDVHPENAKEILNEAKLYKTAQKARLAALESEKNLKQKMLGLIKKAGLTSLPDGTIRFSLDGFTILVKPRDELLQVKGDDEVED